VPWELRKGPFKESDFISMPESHWTVLVQEINKHVPEFALLQERFSFLPNWRLDDVMVSFAQDQGTVGPHIDNYDVFLIQGPGKRRWQISNQPGGPEHLIPGMPLRILKDFQPEQEWILEEGDMLYLPPGVAHHGVALGDCITISVGYRAPAIQEIIGAYMADILACEDPELFYSDPDLKLQKYPGEISQRARRVIREIIHSIPRSDDEIDRWFGHFTTDVRPGHDVPVPEEAIGTEIFLAKLQENGEVWRSEYCRFAYFVDDNNNTLLFVAGDEYPLPKSIAFAAALISGQRVFPLNELQPYLDKPEFVELLTKLHNEGALYFPVFDDEE
jgi:50S ribosomal protein L16 3-hydroxylase